MLELTDRLDRNVRFFGVEGQLRLHRAHVAVVGVGGLGTHVVQQIALLGVGRITLIDDEELSESNKNRYIGARHDDPVPGTSKVYSGERLVRSIDPQIAVCPIFKTLRTSEAVNSLYNVTHIFGCVDGDGPRFLLNDLATAYAIPYIDLATDVVAPHFGGRVVTNWDGSGCLFCFEELDQKAVQIFLESDSDRMNRESVYGIDKSDLDRAGPSVVSLNGVVASLGVTEFMLGCTGLRAPNKFINYKGDQSKVLVRDIPGRPDCPYCCQWGHRERADIGRYSRSQAPRSEGF